jgi:hypothetical protein
VQATNNTVPGAWNVRVWCGEQFDCAGISGHCHLIEAPSEDPIEFSRIDAT